MIGRIRLQWWRECLDGIYDGAARQHEVVQPLAEAIAARQLPRALLEAIIDARELDLDAEPPASLEALRGYVEGTSTSLVRLALHVLGAELPGRLGLLRALPLHARQDRKSTRRNSSHSCAARMPASAWKKQ